MEMLLQDIRYGLRTFQKNPGFTAIAVLTLALGIGANTSIFSVVNGVLLRPLPYREPGQLVRVVKEAPPDGGMVLGGGEFIGGPEFVAWKQQAQSISRIAAYGGGDYNLSGGDQAERIVCGQVTADFFPMLGVQPFLGRTFAPEEDRPAGPKVAVLGHGIWRRRFGGDRGALGRTIRLNNETYTVIGVLPPAFLFPEPFQIWLPLALDDTAEQGRIRISLVHVIARDEGKKVGRVELSVQGTVDRGNQKRTDVTVFNSVRLEFAISGTDGATAAQLVEGFKRR